MDSLKVRYLLLELAAGKRILKADDTTTWKVIRAHIVEVPLKYVEPIRKAEEEYQTITDNKIKAILKQFRLPRYYEISRQTLSVGLVSAIGQSSQFFCRLDNVSILRILEHFARENKILAEDEFLKMLHS